MSWRPSQYLEEPGSSPGVSSASGWGWSMVGWGRVAMMPQLEIGTSSRLYIFRTHTVAFGIYLPPELSGWPRRGGAGSWLLAQAAPSVWLFHGLSRSPAQTVNCPECLPGSSLLHHSSSVHKPWRSRLPKERLKLHKFSM